MIKKICCPACGKEKDAILLIDSGICTSCQYVAKRRSKWAKRVRSTLSLSDGKISSTKIKLPTWVRRDFHSHIRPLKASLHKHDSKSFLEIHTKLSSMWERLFETNTTGAQIFAQNVYAVLTGFSDYKDKCFFDYGKNRKVSLIDDFKRKGIEEFDSLKKTWDQRISIIPDDEFAENLNTLVVGNPAG